MYGKAACPVLRGAGVQLRYGPDIVAPPQKQAENRENKRGPVVSEVSCLLEGSGYKMQGCRNQGFRDWGIEGF
jgi:hypothetical protein